MEVHSVKHLLVCSLHAHLKNPSPILMVQGVWIGADARIKTVVRMRDWANLIAGGVVKRDVLNFAVIVGVPTRLIDWRFSESQGINQLTWRQSNPPGKALAWLDRERSIAIFEDADDKRMIVRDQSLSYAIW